MDQKYGFRGNARNYDLNRDFIKSDTRNTKSFVEIFHTINADVLLTIISNGPITNTNSPILWRSITN
jgi:hypothetical protein